jgi:hypothetical protein
MHHEVYYYYCHVCIMKSTISTVMYVYWRVGLLLVVHYHECLMKSTISTVLSGSWRVLLVPSWMYHVSTINTITNGSQRVPVLSWKGTISTIILSTLSTIIMSTIVLQWIDHKEHHKYYHDRYGYCHKLIMWGTFPAMMRRSWSILLIIS